MNEQNNHVDFLKQTWRNYYLETIRPNMEERAMIYQKMVSTPNSVFSMAVRRKAMLNIVYFFNYFLWVFESKVYYRNWYGQDDGIIPFILFPFQEKFIIRVVEAIETGQSILLEKTREMGASYMVLCVFLWLWLQENAAYDFLIGAHKFEVVDKKGVKATLFEKLRFNIERLKPLGFLPETYDDNTCDNVGLIKTAQKGGASIVGEANNPNFGRSGRYAAALMDEFSFWDETDSAAWIGSGETCGARIVVSTPCGFGKKFTDLRFDGSMEVITLHWEDHPLKGAGKFTGDHPLLPDKKQVALSPWYLWKCEQLKDDPEANVGQELDIDYLTTGMPYFRGQMPYVVGRYKELTEKPIEVKRYEFELGENREIKLIPYPSGRIFILDEAVSGWKYRYCISADTAEGLEHGDNSAFVVYDRIKGHDVCWFAGKCDTHVFALLLVHFGFKYQKAYIGPEKNNTSGGAVLNELKNMYSYIMHEQDFSLRMPRDKGKYGWNTNVATRGIMLGKLRKAVSEKCEGISDLQFYNEAMTFITKNGKPQAESGKLDDRVMTQAIKFMLNDWLPTPRKIEKKVDEFKDMHPFGIKPERKKDARTIWVS